MNAVAKGPCRNPCRKRTGVTLLELLVVVAIIAVLAALLLPAAHAVRLSAKRRQAHSTALALAEAAKNYRGSFGKFPGQTQGSTDQFVPPNVLLAALTNNPRRTVFIELKEAEIDATGALLDPWGNRFVVSMDENANGTTVLNATITPPAGGTITFTTNVARESVCVMSWGHDPASSESRIYSWKP